MQGMHRRLEPFERKTSPFVETPKTNEKPHWVEPKIVVEVKFSEWTADRRLRQPIFLGVRDDKDASEVGVEKKSVQEKSPREDAVGKRSARPSIAARARTERPERPAKQKRPSAVQRPRKIRAKYDPDSLLGQLSEI